MRSGADRWSAGGGAVHLSEGSFVRNTTPFRTNDPSDQWPVTAGANCLCLLCCARDVTTSWRIEWLQHRDMFGNCQLRVMECCERFAVYVCACVSIAGECFTAGNILLLFLGFKFFNFPLLCRVFEKFPIISTVQQVHQGEAENEIWKAERLFCWLASRRSSQMDYIGNMLIY